MKTLFSGFRHTITTAIWLVIAGCIPVADMEEAWQKGFLDLEIEGHWQKLGAKAQFISVVKDGQSFRLRFLSAQSPEPDPGDEGRCLKVGQHRFMMKRSVSCQEVQRYSIENGVLTLYGLREGVLTDSIRRGEVKGSLPAKHEDPNTLNNQNVVLLKTQAQFKGWEQ